MAVNLVPLTAPSANRERLVVDFVLVGKREVYSVTITRDEGGNPVGELLTFHRPGDATNDVRISTELGTPYMQSYEDETGDAVLFWPRNPVASEYKVYRRDRRYELSVPIRPGQHAPEDMKSLLFARQGDVLLVQDQSGQSSAYSTVDAWSRTLGVQSGPLVIDESSELVLVGDEKGVRVAHVVGGDWEVLASSSVQPGSLQVVGPYAWYLAEHSAWRVSIAGGEPPTRVADAAERILAVHPLGRIASSSDADTRYIHGAGDGWIGGRKFMERGTQVHWSSDGDAIRFLEHSATESGAGVLTSVLPDGPSGDVFRFALANNARSFSELPDGRLLVVENAADEGSWNRLVVVDKLGIIKRWVAPSAIGFEVVPGGHAAVAQVLMPSGEKRYVLAQIP